MWKLRGTIQCYGWGSPQTIPDFLGIHPDGQPYAELWYGAHPSGPSRTLSLAPHFAGQSSGASSLDELIKAEAAAVLGHQTHEAFGPRLPFLVKLLAAERPLSLQAHPDAATAREGFARETAAQIPPEQRNYADGEHKPETILALEGMHVLAGFRPPHDVAADLERIGSKELDPVVAALRGPGNSALVMKAAFELVLRLTADELERTLTLLLQEHTESNDATTLPWGSDALRVARELLADYPGDAGVLAATFLNSFELQPGQTLSVGAGVVHCYVRGFGLEIMASSDNVLRAGLTNKRVDKDELLSVLDFEPGPADVRTATVTWPQTGVCKQHFGLPFSEYALDVVDIFHPEFPFRPQGSVGPRLVLALAGAVTVTTSTGRSALTPGEAVLLADNEEAQLAGGGRVAVIGTPQPR